MRFARTTIFPRSHRWRRLLCQRHFFWSPDPKRTFHSTDILHLALFESFQKTGIAPVSGIGHDHVEGYLPLESLIDQLEGDLMFRLCWDITRHMSSFTALGICGPRLRQIQLSTNWPMQDAFCFWFLDNIFGGHHRLTIGWLALHAAVLACHTHGFSSLLEQTGIIESQQPTLWTQGQQVLDSKL